MQHSKRPFEFENKAYSLEDSTPQLVQALKDKVKVIRENVILVDEIPIPSAFSTEILLDEMNRLKTEAGYDQYFLVVDVRYSSRPDAEARRMINSKFADFCNDILHASFITGKNAIINTAIRFIMFQTNLNSFSFDSSLEEAFKSFRKSANG